MKPQQTIEPVHVRADQPPVPDRPVSTNPMAPPAAQTKPAPEAPAAAEQKPAPQKPKQAPASSSNNVTAAIIATVIIVLGIAALAVLAYIKTQK